MNHVDSIFEGEFDFQINAIKEALMSVPDGAQPSVSVEQEPVAWRTYTGRGYYIIDATLEEAQKNWPDRQHQPLYKSPPQRKPLTDEEVEKIIKANMSLQMNLAGIRQDFEAAHGIKGEA